MHNEEIEEKLKSFIHCQLLKTLLFIEKIRRTSCDEAIKTDSVLSYQENIQRIRYVLVSSI